MFTPLEQFLQQKCECRDEILKGVTSFKESLALNHPKKRSRAYNKRIKL